MPVPASGEEIALFTLIKMVAILSNSRNDALPREGFSIIGASLTFTSTYQLCTVTKIPDLLMPHEDSGLLALRRRYCSSYLNHP